jgi:hypothetical protein
MSGNETAKLTVDQARARAGQLQGLYIHTAIAVAVSVLLTIIDIATGDRWWFWWPVGGLAVSVVVHAVMVRRPPRLFSQEWIDDKATELIADAERSDRDHRRLGTSFGRSSDQA